MRFTKVGTAEEIGEVGHAEDDALPVSDHAVEIAVSTDLRVVFTLTRSDPHEDVTPRQVRHFEPDLRFVPPHCRGS